jgi:hypothetical protein
VGIPTHSINVLDGGQTRSDGSRLTIGTITVSTAAAGSSVVSVVIGAGGSGYTSLPTITPVGGTGSGMTIIATTLTAGALSAVQITNSGNYSVAPSSFTVTGGGGSGATVTTATLGAAGNTVFVAVTFSEPMPSSYVAIPSPSLAGDAFVIPSTKTPLGFSLGVAPALAATTLAAASIDVLVVG